ncbi:MAG: hypothetical protein JSS07_00575 [Proteobacteria bacterium]|nr:hypothetical protein [Pseudomonadota bacterium]
MNKKLQDYLALLGIMQWQVRKKEQKKYLLILNEPLNLANNQLLSKMLKALNWSRTASEIEQALNISDKDFLSLIDKGNFEKVLIFGEPLINMLSTPPSNPFSLDINSKQLNIAVLPSLAQLQQDVGAKKQAWSIMQKV